MRIDLDDQLEGILASARAAEYWARMHADASPAQKRDYLRWLKKSQEHVAAALDIGRINGLLREMKPPLSIVDHTAPPSNVVPLRRDPRQSWRTVQEQPPPRNTQPLKIAAAVLVGVVVSALVFALATARRNRAIETAAGESRALVLADGSRVQLGPNSRIRVEFDEQRRVILLLAGDIMSQVAKDAQRPFIVDAGVGTARAVGTEFGVSRYDDRMVVTVTEGIVAVAGGHSAAIHSRAAAHSAGATAARVTVAVSAGQQVKVSNVRLESVRQVDVERELGWVQGKLIFDGQTIGEAAAEFNRRNRLQIEVADGEIAQRPVAAVFDATDPHSFTEFVALAGSINVVRDSPDVLRLERAAATPQAEDL